MVQTEDLLNRPPSVQNSCCYDEIHQAVSCTHRITVYGQ